MNVADIVVIIFVAVLVAVAVLIIHKNRKNEKRDCGGDCSRCVGCKKDKS